MILYEIKESEVKTNSSIEHIATCPCGHTNFMHAHDITKDGEFVCAGCEAYVLIVEDD